MSTDTNEVGSRVPPADELYGESYYTNNFHLPYERNEHRLNFFGRAAERVIAAVNPKNALDVGCAFGFLVESLRDRGVDAVGYDVSEYAIGRAGGSAKGHCHLVSALEPIGQKYDLITCVEVVEHMPPEDGRLALQNMAAATDHLLLSTTPHDHIEPTHLNVQPPEYWAEILAEFNMFRDVDHDASYLTPWAGLFVRNDKPISQIVKHYERSNVRLREEVVALRAAVLQHHARIEKLNNPANSDTARLKNALESAKQGTDAAQARLRTMTTRMHDRLTKAHEANQESLNTLARLTREIERLERQLAVARNNKPDAAIERKHQAEVVELRAALKKAEERVLALETSRTWRYGRALLTPYRMILRKN